MKLSRELDYRIRYDVEHDLFHAQNVFNDEYITPTFVEYVQKLEKENAELKGIKDVATLIRANNDTVVTLMQLNNMLVSKSQQLAKAKEIIKTCLGFMQTFGYSPSMDKFITETEQFLAGDL